MESWERAGVTQQEWVAHVLRKAADRRELARFQLEDGRPQAAQEAMRSALAREVYVARLRGQATAEEVEVVRALLPGWAGSSSDELLSTARAILTGSRVTP